jgi:hypothetical protein
VQRFVATHKSKHIAKHYLIMLARYLHLALLAATAGRYLHLALLAATAATALSQRTLVSADANKHDMARELTGDLNWGIQSEDGYPSIAFDDANECNCLQIVRCI